MNAYPVMLDGAQLRALVVGGGAVALRRVRALRAAGARVRVVAPRVTPELAELAVSDAMVVVLQRAYDSTDIGDATLVIAATDSRDVNARAAADAHAAVRLVMVADAPGDGNCAAAAVHRAGDLVIAVTAGGATAVAARVRDAIADRFDARYAAAAAGVARLRARMLASGRGAEWRLASADIAAEDFCAAVEGGTIEERVARWA